MQREDTVALVYAWQDAANRQDGDRLVELSDPHIEIRGPRGSGYGAQLLRDWLGRAGLTLETRRTFARENIAVLSQHGIWRSIETGETAGEADLASRFRVDNERIVEFERHDTLEAALATAGLSEADEVVPEEWDGAAWEVN